jgi:hypothetical protein
MVFFGHWILIIWSAPYDSLASTFLFAWLDDPQKYPYEMSLRMIDEIFFHNIPVADHIES